MDSTERVVPPRQSDPLLGNRIESHDTKLKKAVRIFFYSLLAIPISGTAYVLFLYFKFCYGALVKIWSDNTISVTFSESTALFFLFGIIGILILAGFIKLALWAWNK